MEFPVYPTPGVLLTRLMQIQETGASKAGGAPQEELSPIYSETLPTEDFLCRLADRVGMRSHDVFLIAGLDIPDSSLYFDEDASRELPDLVQHSLTLSASSRQRLREYAQSLAGISHTVSTRRNRSFEQYPPGFGSLFVRMLGLRNLGWSSAAKVMYLMSGVYLSPATIGAVGRGVKEIDAELLNGFAAVLGVQVTVLASLIGMSPVVMRKYPEEVSDTAALLWEVRHLTAEQVRDISRLEA